MRRRREGSEMAEKRRCSGSGAARTDAAESAGDGRQPAAHGEFGHGILLSLYPPSPRAMAQDTSSIKHSVPALWAQCLYFVPEENGLALKVPLISRETRPGLIPPLGAGKSDMTRGTATHSAAKYM